jgi:CheY-like chemotaxis protein
MVRQANAGRKGEYMRPCFLVVDNEYPGSISTRKLVLESAKLNVLTAYTADEAIRTIERFPNIDGVVVDTQLKGRPCGELIELLRNTQKGMPIITVSPSGHDPCGGEQFHVSTFDPKQLLEAVKKISPTRMSYVMKRENEISFGTGSP